jgi:hypothetical protein
MLCLIGSEDSLAGGLGGRVEGAKGGCCSAVQVIERLSELAGQAEEEAEVQAAVAESQARAEELPPQNDAAAGQAQGLELEASPAPSQGPSLTAGGHPQPAPEGRESQDGCAGAAQGGAVGPSGGAQPDDHAQLLPGVVEVVQSGASKEGGQAAGQARTPAVRVRTKVKTRVPGAVDEKKKAPGRNQACTCGSRRVSAGS